MEQIKTEITEDNEIYILSNGCGKINETSTKNKTAPVVVENESSNQHKSSKNKNRKIRNKVSNAQKIDVKAKLERSRQSARECRARKKLRYQYLEDLVNKSENANLILKKEIEELKEIVSMLSSEQHNLEEIKKRYKSI